LKGREKKTGEGALAAFHHLRAGKKKEKRKMSKGDSPSTGKKGERKGVPS